MKGKKVNTCNLTEVFHSTDTQRTFKNYWLIEKSKPVYTTVSTGW